MSELEKILQKSKEICETSPNEVEEYIETRIKKTSYTLSDIADFVQKKLDDPALDYGSGAYLSMFINAKIKENDEVTLKLNPQRYIRHGESGEKMGDLGYGLPRGKLTIIGNTFVTTGSYQKGGTLIIKGNTDVWLSSNKESGLTIVEGNAKRNACQDMSGGVTIIKGNTGKWTGLGMKGGLFIVEGKITSVADDEYIGTRWYSGIIIEKNQIKKWNLCDWDLNTILPPDKHLPQKYAEIILEAYARKQGQGNLKQLVHNRELEYRVRLRKLDQELPIIIRKIDEPQKKLRALKALEREAANNPKREIITLAMECGVNPNEAIEKHDRKIKQKIKQLKRKLIQK